ncbi:unnamed protein product, partial [Owenia fusiformis]
RRQTALKDTGRCGPPPSRLYSLPGYPAVQQIFKNVHYETMTLYLIGNDGTVGVQSWQLNPGDILTLDTAMRQGYVASSGTGPDKRWLRLGGRCYYYPSSPDTDGCTIYISSF